MSELSLILIRGVPGSGKSTLAQKMVLDSKIKLIHLEADMFFVDEQGRYFFEPFLIKNAHQWCQNKCQSLLKNGTSVVVSNTFVKQWEMKVYRELAVQFKAKLIIKTCNGNYQNIHNVPQSKINKMKKQWEN